MREFKSPFTIGAPPLKAAHLEAKLQMYNHTPTVYNLAITNNPDGTATLTAPTIVCGGVYRLRLTSMDGKCCYSGLVYTDGCPPVTMGSAGATGTHTGDGGVTEPAPSGC